MRYGRLPLVQARYTDNKETANQRRLRMETAAKDGYKAEASGYWEQLQQLLAKSAGAAPTLPATAPETASVVSEAPPPAPPPKAATVGPVPAAGAPPPPPPPQPAKPATTAPVPAAGAPPPPPPPPPPGAATARPAPAEAVPPPPPPAMRSDAIGLRAILKEQMLREFSGTIYNDAMAKWYVLDRIGATAAAELHSATVAYFEATRASGGLSEPWRAAAHTRDDAMHRALDAWKANATESDTAAMALLLEEVQHADELLARDLRRYDELTDAIERERAPKTPAPPATAAAGGFLDSIRAGATLKQTAQGALARVERALGDAVARLAAFTKAGAHAPEAHAHTVTEMQQEVAKLTLDVANAKAAEEAKTKRTSTVTSALAGTIANALVARRAAMAEDDDGSFDFGKARARRFV